MDLWIRTQEKRLVQIVDFLEPRESEEGEIYHLWGFSSIGSFIKLGIYKTKERALEVLDEINRHIEEIYNCVYGLEYDLTQFTYEMPQE